ncbi:MAG: hypothetical protein HF978_14470 [Desulfobacteraceae bacterium]|nr:flavin reductase [Desulfobacteraceae bacterium]MBC2756744.1 hypothetical protein [Desulfobacteraceae bacterium]
MDFNGIRKYKYHWPDLDLTKTHAWKTSLNGDFFVRELPETKENLANDSRWPAFFPAPICLVTTSDGSKVAMERSVGATIVNRFPYILALSFCTELISDRHYPRKKFMKMIEQSKTVNVQFLPPGKNFDKALDAVAEFSDDQIYDRITASGLKVRTALTNPAPVFEDSYMVYEAKLVKPGKDFLGGKIFENPWKDVDSHRLYFFEINAIQLREDIAGCKSQVCWRSLPAWNPLFKDLGFLTPTDKNKVFKQKYQKGYTPHYRFPSSSTTAFEFDELQNGMAVKYLPPLPKDQVEVDNDRARWPCFFPSPLSFVNTWADDGNPNIMPCGSTMVVSRHPMTIAVCIAYAAINERYKPRATLNIIKKTKKFGCGVPYINEKIIDAIQFSGNISFSEDPDKIKNAGLEWYTDEDVPILPALPINFICQVTKEVMLGTHIMFLGEVKKIYIRSDVNFENPMEWFPCSEVKKAD